MQVGGCQKDGRDQGSTPHPTTGWSPGWASQVSPAQNHPKWSRRWR